VTTRIVEKDIGFCQSRVMAALNEGGYRLNSYDRQDSKILKGIYGQPKKIGFYYPPKMRVELTAVSAKLTRVSAYFQVRWGFVVHCTVLALLTLLPFIIRVLLTEITLEINVFWIVLGAGWIITFVIVGSVAIRSEISEHHKMNLKRMIWEHLDPEGGISHEVAEPSPFMVYFFRITKWISLCLAIVGLILLMISTSLANPHSMENHTWQQYHSSDYKVLLRYMLPSCAPVFSIIVLFSGIYFLSSGWVTCSWGLPHRYHWKGRHYATYLCWYAAAVLPGLFLIFAIQSQAMLLPESNLNFISEASIKQLKSLVIVMVLVLQGVVVFALLRLVPGYKMLAGYANLYSKPSTRYEILTEEGAKKDVSDLFKKHKFWTWVNFLSFTILCYLVAIYLALVFTEGVAGIFGTSWPLTHSWYWPLVLPVSGFGASVQAMIFSCLMGLPIFISIVQFVRGRLGLRKKLGLALDFSKDCDKLGLPTVPTASLKKEINANLLRVALIPTLGINIQIERTALFKKEYLLWLTVRAKNDLSNKELEALLWHECGHAELLRRSFWREIVAFLSPWAPRFLDLGEDLYEHERQADIYAAQKMGTAVYLISALGKIEETQRLLRKRTQPRDSSSHGWLSLDSLKMIWNLGWTGYLHPGVDQRLNWLEHWERRIEESLC
jgi:hypothetical protein